jgi:hypothetical protein
LGGDGYAYALGVHDDGTGEALYAGGWFDLAGGQPASRIAKWDGQAWSSLGLGVNAGVASIASVRDGERSTLVVGGGFSQAGGQPAAFLASWDGESWAGIGGGVENWVYTILPIAGDGSGFSAYLGGEFTWAGNTNAHRIAKWSECSADLDGNCSLNFFDVSGFLLFYQLQSPEADRTNDGVLNFFDIAKYLQEFNAGCS